MRIIMINTSGHDVLGNNLLLFVLHSTTLMIFLLQHTLWYNNMTLMSPSKQLITPYNKILLSWVLFSRTMNHELLHYSNSLLQVFFPFLPVSTDKYTIILGLVLFWLPPGPEGYSDSHYLRESIRKAFRIIFPFKISWLTELVEAAALFPVSRQRSSLVHQRRSFSLLHILQVHKQLVVLRLTYRENRDKWHLIEQWGHHVYVTFH